MSAGGGPRGGADALAWGIATAGGLGRVPFAPGTAGSAAAALLYWLLWQAGPIAPLIAWVVILPAAFWSAGRAERIAGRKDPSEVVVDEVAGQFLALLGAAPTPLHLAAGFLLFRLFDIAKPPGIDRLERLEGGWGVVADDLAAGLLVWVLLAGARLLGFL